MKKTILAFLLILSVPILGQTHNIVKSFKGGDIFRDSIRFTNTSATSDSIHYINLGLKYDWVRFALLTDTSTFSRDSVKITAGSIDYTYSGTAYDTTWFDDVWMKDSSGSTITRAVSSNVNTKSWLLMDPAIQILKVELVNYRLARPTRTVHYRLIGSKKEGF